MTDASKLTVRHVRLEIWRELIRAGTPGPNLPAMRGIVREIVDDVMGVKPSTAKTPAGYCPDATLGAAR